MIKFPTFFIVFLSVAAAKDRRVFTSPALFLCNYNLYIGLYVPEQLESFSTQLKSVYFQIYRTHNALRFPNLDISI